MPVRINFRVSNKIQAGPFAFNLMLITRRFYANFTFRMSKNWTCQMFIRIYKKSDSYIFFLFTFFYWRLKFDRLFFRMFLLCVFSTWEVQFFRNSWTGSRWKFSPVTGSKRYGGEWKTENCFHQNVKNSINFSSNHFLDFCFLFFRLQRDIFILSLFSFGYLC